MHLTKLRVCTTVVHNLDYDYGNPGFKGGTGHFTQVVWKSSTKLGIGVARNTMNGKFQKSTQKSGYDIGPGYLIQRLVVNQKFREQFCVKLEKGYNGWLIVGRYKAHGNMQGSFPNNVMQLK